MAASLFKKMFGFNILDVVKIMKILYLPFKYYGQAVEKSLDARGFIRNTSKENVVFIIYNANNWCINTSWWWVQWVAFKAHRTCAQPQEKVVVHGAPFRTNNEDLKVWVEGHAAKMYYNVIIGKTYTWNGEKMKIIPAK